MACLYAALALFVAFHFLPDIQGRELGWHIWEHVGRDLLDPKHLNSEDAICDAFLLNFSLLVIVSPWMKNIWPRSLWTWWGAMMVGCLMAAAGGLVLAMQLWRFFAVGEEMSAGLVFLGAALILNFLGLLLARPRALPRN